MISEMVLNVLPFCIKYFYKVTLSVLRTLNQNINEPIKGALSFIFSSAQHRFNYFKIFSKFLKNIQLF